MPPTEGFSMTSHEEHDADKHVPAPGEATVPELEDDETIPPRPEEEIADRLRAKPDVADHSDHHE
jgi:hypothetical protein